jgi:hypothetical protein
MTFADGVSFDEAKHEYWYNGKRLSGVTGLITKKLALKMPEDFMEEHRLEGVHVHKAVQRWVETGEVESVHPGVRWIVDTFLLPGREVLVSADGKEVKAGAALFNSTKIVGVRPANTYSEVLVSDFKQYASAVDIVREGAGGGLTIYDIKKGIFKRDYVTLQLSIYKYFIEKYAGRKVDECVCICMKDKEYYPVFPKPFDAVEKLLYAVGS